MTNAPNAPGDGDIVRFGGGFIVVCLAFISLFAVGSTIGDIKHYLSVDSWIETPARVTRSTVESPRDGGSGRRDDDYKPLAAIAYEFGGEPITQDRFELAPPTSREEAGRIAKAHPADHPITIFVDPDHPTRATIDDDPPLVTATSVGFLIPSILFWAYFGGWLVPAMLRNRRDRRAARAGGA